MNNVLLVIKNLEFGDRISVSYTHDGMEKKCSGTVSGIQNSFLLVDAGSDDTRVIMYNTITKIEKETLLITPPLDFGSDQRSFEFAQ